MRQSFLALVGMTVMGCMSSAPTRVVSLTGGGGGRFAWFAEVTREQVRGRRGTERASGEDDLTLIIMCNAGAAPLCVRFEPQDAYTVGELREWLARVQDAERANQQSGAIDSSSNPP
jgi:hypothetical protein